MMFEPISVHPDKTVFWVTALFAVLTTLLFGYFRRGVRHGRTREHC